MITDGQMNVVEDCCLSLLQKISNARIADANVRNAAAAAKTLSTAYLRDVEKIGRNADRILTAGVDQLNRELAKLPGIASSRTKASKIPVERLRCDHCDAVVPVFARSQDFLCHLGHQLPVPDDVEFIVVRHRVVLRPEGPVLEMATI